MKKIWFMIRNDIYEKFHKIYEIKSELDDWNSLPVKRTIIEEAIVVLYKKVLKENENKKRKKNKKNDSTKSKKS